MSTKKIITVNPGTASPVVSIQGLGCMSTSA
jgi:hypothetical protein